MIFTIFLRKGKSPEEIIKYNIFEVKAVNYFYQSQSSTIVIDIIIYFWNNIKERNTRHGIFRRPYLRPFNENPAELSLNLSIVPYQET